MSGHGDWSGLWRRLLSRRQMEEDLDAEIRFHIEGRVDALMEEGMDERDARRKAQDDFGNMGRIRADMARASRTRHRRQHREEFARSFLRDLALTFREIGRNPGFAAVAILTLALGIGANTAMFSVVNGVILRPLPYQDPHRLVAVWPTMNFNMTLVDSIEAETPSLDGVTGISYWGLTITGDAAPESVNAAVVSTTYFDVLGVPPMLGRGFTSQERDPERSDVAVLSHGFWQRRFGGDRSILGARIQLAGYDHESRQVIGVAPPGFQPPDRRADVWIPLHLSPGHTVATDSTWYVNQVVARLAPGSSVEQASRDVARAAEAIHAQFPERIREEQVRQASTTPLLDQVLGDSSHLIWILLGAVALVLVIACANLANLLLARAGRQARDAAIRTALGATRGRLVRQHLTTALALAALGAVGGIGLARVVLGVLLPGLDAEALPRAATVGISPLVLLFTAGAAGLSALGFGLVPAFRVGRGGLRGSMEGGGRSRSADRSAHRLNRVLVAAETALAVVLVMGAALMLRSVWNLYRTDPGFRAEGVVAMVISPSDARYGTDGDAARSFMNRVEEGIRRIPGVESAGAIHLLPLTSNNWSFPYLAEDHRPPEGAPLPTANFRIVTPGYFETLAIPLLRGRAFDAADGPDDLPVGLVNQAMADLLWPGADPLGKEILLFGNQPFQVVGVVGNVKQHGLDREPLPEMYRPFNQYSWPGLVTMVRSRSADAAELAPMLRQAVWDADPDVPVPTVKPLTQVLSDSLARPRFFAQLLGAFGLLALLLGAMGIYGVMSHLVGARMREFGVRMALGASPTRLVREALTAGMVPVASGLVLGTAAALLSSRLIRGVLFGVEPADASTLLLVLLVLAGAGFAATWVPARRASRADPVEVLSVE